MNYLDTIKKLALAANTLPAKWWIQSECENNWMHSKDAAYIAACSPERILAMIAVIEAAKALRSHGPRSTYWAEKHAAIFDAMLMLLEKP